MNKMRDTEADEADIFDGCEHIEDGICAECLRERRAARATTSAGVTGEPEARPTAPSDEQIHALQQGLNCEPDPDELNGWEWSVCERLLKAVFAVPRSSGAPAEARPSECLFCDAGLPLSVGKEYTLHDFADAVEDAARLADTHLTTADEQAQGSDTSTGRVARMAAAFLRAVAGVVAQPADEREKAL